MATMPPPPMSPPPMMTPPTSTAPARRPTGVTILAILGFVGAGLLVLFGILAFAMAGVIAEMMEQYAGDGFGMMGGAFGAAMGVAFIVFAAIPFVIGLGFWKGWTFMWWIAVVLWALSILSNLASIGRQFVASIIGIAIYLFLLWYITQKGVQRWFKVNVNLPWAK